MIPRKIGQKVLRVFPESKALNKWFDRPACTESQLPMKGALSIYDGIDPLRQNAKGSIGYIKAPGNDVINISGTFCTSSVNGNGHGYSVIADNFNKALITWAVRQIIQPSWTNDRDQFAQPNIDPLPDEFISNCVVWCLFHGSNQTSSLKDVKYDGKTYQVRNEFFPYLLSEMSKWTTPMDLSGQFRTAKDTFVAGWLKGRGLSTEAQALLDAGRKVYQVFYKEWNNLNHRKFKIDNWDCGLVELTALKDAHMKLTLKLRPKVYEYGFLDEEIIFAPF
jgi:predicted GNAT family acetyltransferase